MARMLLIDVPLPKRAIVCLMLILCSSIVAGQNCGLTWDLVTPDWPVHSLVGAAFGNGRYVVVGGSGTVYYSGDAVHWERGVLGTTRDCIGVAFGSGLFVAMTKSGPSESIVAYTSGDGEKWEVHTLPFTCSQLNRLRYAGSNFFALGNSGLLLTSSDGVNWVQPDLSAQGNFQDVTFGNAQYIVVGASTPIGHEGLIMASDDAVHWTHSELPQGPRLDRIIWAGDHFWATPGIWSSPDAVHWEHHDLELYDPEHSIAWSGSTLVAGGGPGFLASVDGGETWCRSFTPASTYPSDIIYAQGLFLAVSDKTISDFPCLCTSADGMAWKDVMAGASDRLSGLAAGAVGAVALGRREADNSTVFLQTADGAVWRDVSPGPNFNGDQRVMIFDGTRFVALGDHSAVLTSYDGLKWDIHPRLPMSVSAIAKGDGILVAVGNQDRGNREQGFSSVSRDGMNWSTPSFVTEHMLIAIEYGNSVFVGLSTNQTWRYEIFSSEDGMSWMNRTTDSDFQPSILAFGGSRFVALSTWGQCQTSADGIVWERQDSIEGAHDLKGLAYSRGRFVAVGAEGQVWTSADGATWEPHPIEPTLYFWNILAGDSRFLASGYDSVKDTPCYLTSEDGFRWEYVERPADEGTDRPVLAFGKGIFVGFAKPDHFTVGFVLSSPDGSNWSRETISFSAPLAVAYGDGGYIAVGGEGALYSSPDGQTWSAKRSWTSENLSSIAYGNGRYAAVGYNRTVLTSSDGEVWVAKELGSLECPKHISFCGGRFFISGHFGLLLSSEDGLNWETLLSSNTLEVGPVAFGGGFYVVASEMGGQDAFLLSSDLKTWIALRFDSRYSLSGLTYGAYHFVATTLSQAILISPDGVSWFRVNAGISAQGDGYLPIAYGMGAFLAAGDRQTLLRSECDWNVSPPTITSISRSASPFRIIIWGSNFQENCKVYINGSVWAKVKRQSDQKLVLSGSALKAAVPKNQFTAFEVQNPDGGIVASFWKR